MSVSLPQQQTAIFPFPWLQTVLCLPSTLRGMVKHENYCENQASLFLTLTAWSFSGIFFLKERPTNATECILPVSCCSPANEAALKECWCPNSSSIQQCTHQFIVKLSSSCIGEITHKGICHLLYWIDTQSSFPLICTLVHKHETGQRYSVS